MSEILSNIREIVLEKCEQHKKNLSFGYYDYWNDHIKRVVYHAVILANRFGANAEIVELGAMLHDISMPSEYGERSRHHIYSTEMTEKMLTELNYPKDKIELVKKCVFNHAGENKDNRDTIEEFCIADADALAHFDRIPSLFSLAYNIHQMSLEEGRDYVKARLQGDYNGLSQHLKPLYKEKYETIMELLFVD